MRVVTGCRLTCAVVLFKVLFSSMPPAVLNVTSRLPASLEPIGIFPVPRYLRFTLSKPSSKTAFASLHQLKTKTRSSVTLPETINSNNPKSLTPVGKLPKQASVRPVVMRERYSRDSKGRGMDHMQLSQGALASWVPGPRGLVFHVVM
eukprot:648143-Prorocentrum_minimum.AAC.2